MQSSIVDVSLATSSDFEEYVSSRGVEFFDLGTDIQAGLASQTPHEDSSGWPSVLGLALGGLHALVEAEKRMESLAERCSLLVYHRNTAFCRSIASAVGIPAVLVAFQPMAPTQEFPYCAINWPSWFADFRVLTTISSNAVARGLDWRPIQEKSRAIANRATYVAQRAQESYFLLPQIKLGLLKRIFNRRARSGAIVRQRRLVLHAYSRFISPRPRDWGSSVVITGYWRSNPPLGSLVPGLEEFLNAGDKPIYVGFGSMPMASRVSFETLAKAVRIWGGRAVICTGWNTPVVRNPTKDVFVLKHAPHEILFGRVSAAIHHGGAGTTHAAAMAGLPTFIVPYFFDQHFWARQLFALGVGPKPCVFRSPPSSYLAETMADLTTRPQYAMRAAELAEQMAIEGGREFAADLIRAVLK